MLISSVIRAALSANPMTMMDFSQRIDHFDEMNKNTFSQRCFTSANLTNGRNQTGIIIHIDGQNPFFSVNSSMDSIIALSNRTNFPIFMIEQRYFGGSVPFANLSVENLKYLTVEQSLEDIAAIAGFIRNHYCIHPNCSVLCMGRFFSGTISSMLRQKYPHLFNFSYSSSSPLEFDTNISDSDGNYGDILASFNRNCNKNTQSLLELFETVVIENKTEELNDLRGKIGLNASTSRQSSLYILSLFISNLVKYNHELGLLSGFCESQNGDQPNESEFFRYFKKYLAILNETADQMDPLLTEGDDRSWLWLQCNQVGLFYAPAAVRTMVNSRYFQNVCQSLFSVGLPDTNRINREYGGSHPKSSMSIYTSGKSSIWPSEGIAENDTSLKQLSIHYNYSFPAEDLVYKNEGILRILEDWLTDNCSRECINGVCSLGTCICDNAHFGEKCDKVHITNSIYMTFSALVVLLPTFMVVIIGWAAWSNFLVTEGEKYASFK